MPGGLTGFTTFSPSEAARRYLDGLPDGTTVAVALSGGGDSVGLLVALYYDPACRAGRVRLVGITVDHGLRSDSAGEAAAMADFCRTLSIPHLTMLWQADKPKTGLSDAARQARYRLLSEGVDRLGADCLVTAHTLDDQLETVEMRRRRSEASVRGLAGIAPAVLFFGRLQVHRPFLRARRDDIRAYLSAQDIRWFDDPSNDNPRYERVRVRQAGQFALDAGSIAAAARKRADLAEMAAGVVAAHVRMPLPLLFEFETGDESEAGNLVLATLIAIAGGQSYLPGREQMDGLRLSLRTRSAVSLGRTVVERRKNALYVGRDRRNLPTLQLPPGESVDWDGRFRMVNNSCDTVTIAPSGVAGPGRGVPQRIAQRALFTLPTCVSTDPGIPETAVHLLLAPFETVLPCFDRPLSDALCRVSERPLFPGFLGAGVERVLINS